MKRQRMTDEGIKRIVCAIEASDALQALAWRDIQQLAKVHAGFGYVWTRQALERHAPIKKAYLAHEEARRRLLRDGRKPVRRLSESQKMARLEQEVEVLRERLSGYDELFATYVGNAVAHGLTVEQLSKPLTSASRGAGNSDKF